MAVKKATKKAARKKATRKTAARRKKVSDDEYLEKVLEGMKKVMLASLGVYGEAFDELKDRVEKLRADSKDRIEKARVDGSSKYDELAKRGQKMQKQLEKDTQKMKKDAKKKISDIDLPSKDLKENLEKMREGINDLLDTLFVKS